jgi:hypothetical protein
VVITTGPAAGKANVSVDGGAATTVDLFAATTGQRKIVLGTGALSVTTAHTVVVAATGTRVDLDAFATCR